MLSKGFKCLDCGSYIVPPQKYTRKIKLCKCDQYVLEVPTPPELMEHDFAVRNAIRRLTRIDEARIEETVHYIPKVEKRHHASVTSLLRQIGASINPKHYFP